jgi:DNA-binding transcriptional LysR family regulator
MDLAQLRSLVAIAQYGSFRRAARHLHLAQPSLSQQIRRLESELGVQVVDRSRRPVALTEPGQALLARAQGILKTIDETTAELRDFDANYRGRVAVGAMQYLAHLELPRLLATFRNKCPAAELHLRIGNTGEVRDLLVNGEVDVALIHADPTTLPGGFVARPLRTERLVLLTARSDPLASRKHVSWPDVAAASFILFREGAALRAALLDACASAGFSPRATLETADIASAVTLIAQGLGVALVPESFAKAEAHRVAHVPIGDSDLALTVTLAWEQRAYQSRALAAFKALAVEAFAAGTPG